VAAVTASPAQTLTTLFAFDKADGAGPWGFVQGTDGNLYGGTSSGAVAGTVFEITPSGALTTLHDFCHSRGCPDGGIPDALVLGRDGNFYGTTLEGGATRLGGMVFRITAHGEMTTLYEFCATSKSCPDGSGPIGGLVQGIDGDFYGTTLFGGTHQRDAGTVFKITPSGELTTLYSFCAQTNCTDGYNPYGLALGDDGGLYGTTCNGGNNNFGTVFKISTEGTPATLHSFSGSDGSCPEKNALVQGPAGTFYGTTHSGGAHSSGTVFEMTPTGTLTTLYSFCSMPNCIDGGAPDGLVVGPDALYGFTGDGGEAWGTIFKITSSGALTTLYEFKVGTDGGGPSGLLQATDGNFYGTTGSGGSQPQGYGTVFRLSMGLDPFVQTVPALGNVGTVVTILGTDLTGATSVTFDGTPAAITFFSSTEIRTTVPAGATTGKIDVTTPRGTLASNVPFYVL